MKSEIIKRVFLILLCAVIFGSCTYITDTSEASASIVSFSESSLASVTTAYSVVTEEATTEKTEETTVEETEVPPVEEVSVPLIDITEDAYIKYTYGVGNFKDTEMSKSMLIYDFADELYTGIGYNQTEPSYNEMYEGLCAYIEDEIIFFKAYNYTENAELMNIDSVKLISDADVEELIVSDKYDYSAIDVSEYKNGLYKICMDVSYETSDISYSYCLYFYVNGDEVYLCKCSYEYGGVINKLRKRAELVSEMLEMHNITPENSLDISGMAFPFHSGYGEDAHNHTEDIVAFSKTLVNENWTDGHKVLVFHDWMTANFAYDLYSYEFLDTQRSYHFEEYGEKYCVWCTGVGTCFHFTNIFAIMCRANGIPCVTADNSDHTWNIVYVNGDWIEIDITIDVERVVYEDMTKIENADEIYSYIGYNIFNNTSDIECINKWLWTIDASYGRNVCTLHS